MNLQIDELKLCFDRYFTIDEMILLSNVPDIDKKKIIDIYFYKYYNDSFKNIKCNCTKNKLCPCILNVIYKLYIKYNCGNNMIKNEPIGNGSYGTVYSIDSLLVSKVIKDIECGFREIIFLNKLYKYENISMMVTWKFNKFNMSELILARYKSALDFKIKDSNTIKKVFYSIISGFISMYNNNIMHCDLKNLNILYNNDDNISICDFSISKYVTFDIDKNDFCVQTVSHASPELLLKKCKINHKHTNLNQEIDKITSYSYEIDIWSIGIIIINLIYDTFQSKYDSMHDVRFPTHDINMLNLLYLTSIIPFNKDGSNIEKLCHSIRELYNNQTNCTEFLGEGFDLIKEDHELYNILKKMLKINPKERISISDMLNDPYFNDYNKYHNNKILTKYEKIYKDDILHIKLDINHLISMNNCPINELFNLIKDIDDYYKTNSFYNTCYLMVKIISKNMIYDFKNAKCFVISCYYIINIISNYDNKINIRDIIKKFADNYIENHIYETIKDIINNLRNKVCFTTPYDYLIYYCNYHNISLKNKIACSDLLKFIMINVYEIYNENNQIIALYIIKKICDINIYITKKEYLLYDALFSKYINIITIDDFEDGSFNKKCCKIFMKIDENIIDKDKVDENIIDKDKIDENIIDKDKIDENIIDKDKIDENIIDKDKIDKNIIDKDKIDENIIDKDKIDKNIIDKDKIDKNIIDKDKIDKNIIDKDKIDENIIALPKHVEILYGKKKIYDNYYYRYVIIPEKYCNYIPKKLMTEEECIILGIKQSEGWEHYCFHPNESNLLLFKKKITQV
jgi:serine/threonine protein kinase